MTLTELLTNLRTRLADSDDSMWSSATKTLYLNDAHRRYRTLLYELTEWRLTTYNVPVVAGTAEYDLPLGFYLARYLRDADGQRIPIERDVFPPLSTERGSPVRAYIYGNYEVAGTPNSGTTYAKLGFYPVPDAAQTMVLGYFPVPFTMATETDVPALPAPFHDLLIWDAGAKCLKDRGLWELAREWERDRAKRESELMDFATHRQRYAGTAFQDVFGHDDA